MKKFLFLLCSLLVGIAVGWLSHPVECDVGDINGIETDTIVKMDTVFCDVPVVKECVTVKFITRWLPVAVKPEVETSGTVAKGTKVDTLGTVAGTCGEAHVGVVSTSAGGLPDSCSLVTIPIEQKIYAGYEYTAWVSGYEAVLDSIQIYNRTELVTNTTYIDKKRRRWGLMIGTGAGIDHKGLCAPMVGVMVGYKIF